MRQTCLLIALFCSTLIAHGCGRVANAPPSPTVVIVVRHAEKAVVEGNDPPLSDAGVRRADALARVAEDAGVSVVYRTQFRRTIETATPLVSRTGAQLITLEVIPDDVRSYVERLAADILDKHRGRTIAVVSHSNTVPLIVERLGGTPVPPIADNSYDNFYVVVIPTEGAARTIKARYGE